MSSESSTAFGRAIHRFFEQYLPHLRGMSIHTIRSYRDALVLYIQFASKINNRPIERLDINDVNRECVMGFLRHLESERGNSIATRNARLAALHTFARFLVAEHPDCLALLQGVLAIPVKRGAREKPIDYFESNEMAALLGSIDRSTSCGARDYVLFALLFNTGARVQEILDLRIRDIRLESPSQVRLHGKGNKVRLCPIWPGTASLLRDLISGAPSADKQDSTATFVFRNHRGGKLTRFGVRYRLKKHVTASASDAPTVLDKQLHPHSLRHSTAIHLLKSGVDFATISQWLGHASVDTTMRYARADLDIKRAALSQVFPEVLSPPDTGQIADHGANLTSWLRKL